MLRGVSLLLLGWTSVTPQALLLHLLHLPEHFCLLYPTEMPCSSSDHSPAPPCTLPANYPARNCLIWQGEKGGFPASQRLCKIYAGSLVSIPDVLWRLEMPSWATSAEMQLSLNPSALAEIGKCLWEVAAASSGQGVIFFSYLFIYIFIYGLFYSSFFLFAPQRGMWAQFTMN